MTPGAIHHAGEAFVGIVDDGEVVGELPQFFREDHTSDGAGRPEGGKSGARVAGKDAPMARSDWRRRGRGGAPQPVQL